MKRTKQNQKKVNAILTADWHLREDTPICRTDDFWQAQWKKIDFIRDLQIKYDCPVIHAGDLFNHWKPSPYLLNQTIKHLPDNFYTIYGNHDLPQHQIELHEKTGTDNLLLAGKLSVLEECHWNQEPRDGSLFFPSFPKERSVLFWHVMTWTGNQPWPGCTDLPAERLLDKFPQFDLIVTGHNHKAFVVEKDGRVLVNPGSLTRQEADKDEHKPRVYLWYAKSNTVTPVYLPIEKNVISREHLDRVKERDERISAFVERLDTDWQIGISFEENLERFEKENKVRKSVMEIIWRALE
jgi:DNA repair exonuclease SbcCD nuclease subunit